MTTLSRLALPAAAFLSSLLASSPFTSATRVPLNWSVDTTEARRLLRDAGGGSNQPQPLHFHFSTEDEEIDFDAVLDNYAAPASRITLDSGVEIPLPASSTFRSVDSSAERCVVTFLGSHADASDLSFDGLCISEAGRYLHIHANEDGIASAEDDTTTEPILCGAQPSGSRGGGRALRRSSTSTKAHVHPIPRNLLVERWTDCYPGDESANFFSIGVAIGSRLFNKYSTTEKTAANVAAIIAESNLVYETQVNIKLVLGELYIQTQGDEAPAWDDSSCSAGIEAQLEGLKSWSKPSEQGVWHLLNDCFGASGGVAGLAYVGVLCASRGYNTGVTFDMTGQTWKIFAHEIGHNFGADHSFEEGQGTTGGIMDYGDFKLNGEYQFNTKYRKDEMCAEISSVVKSCPSFSKSPVTATAAPSAPVQTNPPTDAPTSAPTCKSGGAATCAQLNEYQVPENKMKYCSVRCDCDYFEEENLCLNAGEQPPSPTATPTSEPTKKPTSEPTSEQTPNPTQSTRSPSTDTPTGTPRTQPPSALPSSVDTEGPGTRLPTTAAPSMPPTTPETEEPATQPPSTVPTCRDGGRFSCDELDRYKPTFKKLYCSMRCDCIYSEMDNSCRDTANTLPPVSSPPTTCNPNSGNGLVCIDGKKGKKNSWDTCGKGSSKFSGRKHCPKGLAMCSDNSCVKEESWCDVVKISKIPCPPVTGEPTEPTGECGDLVRNLAGRTRRACDSNEDCAVVKVEGKITCVERDTVAIEDICLAMNRRRNIWTKNWCRSEPGCKLKFSRRGRRWRCEAKEEEDM